MLNSIDEKVSLPWVDLLTMLNSGLHPNERWSMDAQNGETRICKYINVRGDYLSIQTNSEEGTLPKDYRGDDLLLCHVELQQNGDDGRRTTISSVKKRTPAELQDGFQYLVDCIKNGNIETAKLKGVSTPKGEVLASKWDETLAALGMGWEKCFGRRGLSEFYIGKVLPGSLGVLYICNLPEGSTDVKPLDPSKVSQPVRVMYKSPKGTFYTKIIESEEPTKTPGKEPAKVSGNPLLEFVRTVENSILKNTPCDIRMLSERELPLYDLKYRIQESVNSRVRPQWQMDAVEDAIRSMVNNPHIEPTSVEEVQAEFKS